MALPINELIKLLTLQDPNSRVVLLGTAVLGFAAGIIGIFALLRKRALVGDALSHAALPGICLAFLIIGHKSFLGLLTGAMITGTLGILLMLLIVKYSRISEDAAIGIVLSSFFGAGICLSRIVQNQANGMQAGLDSFIYGKAASMLREDALLIIITCSVILLISRLLFKEFSLICFDSVFAETTGWPVLLLDIILMCCIVAVTIVGLQSVGVVLIISLLITPAASARFWSNDLKVLYWLSGIFGSLSALIGSAISALYANLSTGPMIVLVGAFIFIISCLFAPNKGLIMKGLKTNVR